MPAVTAPPLAKRRPDVPVEVLAARTISLATLGPRRRAERRQESVAALEALAGASLLELRQKLPTRYWVLPMLSLMGKSTREIADQVGNAGSAPVVRLPVDEATLPAFTPMGTPCRGCGQRTRQMVMFDRNCRQVTGDHFHRRCLACDATWVERCPLA